MNAIADNTLTKALAGMTGTPLARPSAIVAISAHWVTRGTLLQASARPKTIHDFGGFPEALYQIQYPAPGAPELAQELARAGLGEATEDWGLDHGVWSVLRHVYPGADIPVMQMSINADLDFQGFYDLGGKLRTLRERGVLIVGSGNVVHNLRRIRWEDDAAPFDWAIEFDQKVRLALANGDHQALIDVARAEPAAMTVAHPTAEHYIPLLYALGATTPKDKLTTVFEGVQNGSISMRTVIWG
jgi:4,5-DOPA dioxygenase extradiol